MDPLITCVYATARQSVGAMIGRSEDHIKLYLDLLKEQTLPHEDFEVIIADCYYGLRQDHVVKNTYKGVEYPFKVIHFQVISPWIERGCWTGQAPWNQATMLANGELLCLFGDCCEPPSNYLENIWRWYEKGYWAMSLVIYKTGGRLALKDMLEEKGELGKHKDVLGEKTGILAFKKVVEMGLDPKSRLIRDSRWPFVERTSSGVLKFKGETGGENFHGYSSVPLQALLKVNGFDENFDGDKALGDVDMGMRLARAGYHNQLLLDRNIWIYENAHYGIPDDFLTYKGTAIRSNYSLMMLNQRERRFRANSYRLSEEEVDFICEHSKSWGFKDIDQRANPLFQDWLLNPPIFNLQELRWDVQDKLEDGIIEIPDYYGWE